MGLRNYSFEADVIGEPSSGVFYIMQHSHIHYISGVPPLNVSATSLQSSVCDYKVQH